MAGTRDYVCGGGGRNMPKTGHMLYDLQFTSSFTNHLSVLTSEKFIPVC